MPAVLITGTPSHMAAEAAVSARSTQRATGCRPLQCVTQPGGRGPGDLSLRPVLLVSLDELLVLLRG